MKNNDQKTILKIGVYHKISKSNNHLRNFSPTSQKDSKTFQIGAKIALITKSV